MKRIVIFFVIFLSGCGFSESPLDAEKIYDDLMICTGLSTGMPDIAIIDDLIWPEKGSDGVYYEDTELIIIKKSYSRDPYLLAHEFLHHLLYKNNRNPDSCHTNQFFLSCARYAGKGC